MDTIILAHGSGGKKMHSLIKDTFVNAFDNIHLKRYGDGAVVKCDSSDIVFTTDSYVIDPLFFPGGDIGTLAVAGTVNDISVMGADPRFLSCGLILEEGFSREELVKIIDSMKKTAESARCEIVTGDTKVVERGKGDKIFINTSAIGTMRCARTLTREGITPKDAILINGFIGDHGIAVLSKREGMEFETTVESDVTPLNDLIGELFAHGLNVKFMRDPTRGGIGSTLNEICTGMRFGMVLHEEKVPVREEVRGLCEILGLDPLYVANEGKVVIVIDRKDVDTALEIMKNHKDGKDCALIGEVTGDYPGSVVMKTVIGSHRIVDMLSGEQLPRIC